MSEEMNKGSNTDLTTEGSQDTEKTYTQAEVDMLLQKEGDRRVSQMMKKQEEKFARKLAEAEKLRDMDEGQRREYEYNSRLKELEQKEKDFAIAQNKLEASKILSNRGLPVDFVEYIVAEDAETMMENITVFERAFKAAVADEVARKIASPVPKTGAGKQTGMTKEEFRTLSTAQQAEIYRTNPELYRSMTTN